VSRSFLAVAAAAAVRELKNEKRETDANERENKLDASVVGEIY
jgi:hypothetical protein